MKLSWLGRATLASFLLVSCLAAAPARPNIVIVLVDDMGFSDIGCYGSEIPTPHVDELATNGLRFTQFYNTARCCPTRASLLTGLVQHQAGVGLMTNPLRHPESLGYLGHLNDRCLTLAEALRSVGYHTYMSGKWHLGQDQREWWPLQRGFERFYGILAGATSYFRPSGKYGLTLDNDNLPPPEDPDYYTTDAFTDYALRFLREQNDDRPFLLYLAYNAPHWPLHAPQTDVEKFVGRYLDGWDRIREQRHARQLALGVVRKEWGLSPRDPAVRAWDALTPEQKTQLDYRMATYAAQIYRVDLNLGRLTTALRELGKLDNTLILFLSDNGASAEASRHTDAAADLGGGTLDQVNDPDVVTSISYGRGWAGVSNTPFAGFKTMSQEGGIATALVVHWPAGLGTRDGTITHAPASLIDIMPTVLEISKAEYSPKVHGNPLHPLEGATLRPIFATGSRPQPEWMYWEHRHHGAVRHGPWKAMVHMHTNAWSLYNMDLDRAERDDLATKHPELLDRLRRRWETWADTHLVYPKPTGERRGGK